MKKKLAADFPLTVPVIKHAVNGTSELDELGNAVVVGKDSNVLVFAAWIPSSDELAMAGHERVVVDARLAAAPGEFTDKDEVTVPQLGGRFVVEGAPHNYESNPWWQPGLETVNLRRIYGAERQAS